MLKILIIDNNQTFRQMLADMLKGNFSGEVRCLNGNSPDVLNEFREYFPDVLFIDIQSTEQNCMDFTKSFKLIYAGVCVIWLTSCNTPEYLQKARDGGIDYCLSKDSMTSDGVINLIRMVYRANGLAPSPDVRQKA